MANKRFTTIPHDHCLGFEVNSAIIEVQEDVSMGSTIVGSAYNFKTLKEVKDAVQLHMLDLIAVIQEVRPIGSITVKATGEMKDKRTIGLVDESGIGLDATLWGDLANIDMQEGQIIAIQGARVSTYGGRSLNIGNDHAKVEFDPKD